MSWVLIIMIYVASSGPGGSATGGPAMTTVPGFVSEEACNNAGERFQNANSGPGRFGFYCMGVQH